jgi:ribose/xylose/arabinose/galactoside ABC-type transport system permease subunit
MSTAETSRRRPRAGDAAPFAILAMMLVVLALVPVLTEHTVRTANVYDIFQNFASYGLVALALGITIIAGEFDLSVSSMYLLGGMVAVLTGAGSPLLGIAAALGTAVLVGLVQGSLIGAITALVVSGLILVWFLDHPYQDQNGSIKPDEMERTLTIIRAEHRAVDLPCDEAGRPVGRPA